MMGSKNHQKKMRPGSRAATLSGMGDIERIEHDGIIYAIVFRRDIPVSGGVRFLTNDTDGLQVGLFEREGGYVSAPHRHVPRHITLEHPGEFLSIERGTIRATIFDDGWQTIAERTVCAGECIGFLRGGHAITVIESARILEVKQGPYQSEDKIFRPAP